MRAWECMKGRACCARGGCVHPWVMRRKNVRRERFHGVLFTRVAPSTKWGQRARSHRRHEWYGVAMRGITVIEGERVGGRKR